jgi:hypothetical protein
VLLDSEGTVFCTLALEPGRCCHESVPDRARLVALVVVFAAGEGADPEAFAIEFDVVPLARFTAAKPLKSGTASVLLLCSSVDLAFMLVSELARSCTGAGSERFDERFDEGLKVGVLSSRIDRGITRLLKFKDVGAMARGLSGEMDRARSTVEHLKISTLRCKV